MPSYNKTPLVPISAAISNRLLPEEVMRKSALRAKEAKEELHKEARLLYIKTTLLQTVELTNIQKKIISYFSSKAGVGKKMPYLFGENGIGKTHIAKELGLCFIDKTKGEKQASFYSVPQVLLKCRKYIRDLELITNKVKYSPFLILDDIFTHKISQFTLEVIYDILEYRVSYNMPTVMTSNISQIGLAEELYRRGGDDSVPLEQCKAVADRVVGISLQIEMKGSSFRVLSSLNAVKQNKK